MAHPSTSNGSSAELDRQFYLNADSFFSSVSPYGLTFDDISLATLYSAILPRQTNL